MRTKCIIIMVLYINQRIRRGKKIKRRIAKKNYIPRPRDSKNSGTKPILRPPRARGKGTGMGGGAALKLKFLATIIKSHLSLTISFDH